MTDQEINEAVAKKLGWKQCLDHPAGLLCRTGSHEPIPDYCRDIGAAWEIVEEVNKSGWAVQLGSASNNNKWFFGGMLRTDVYERWEEYADTQPMAICLAFLKVA